MKQTRQEKFREEELLMKLNLFVDPTFVFACSRPVERLTSEASRQNDNENAKQPEHVINHKFPSKEK